jgi:hypothetical protein
MINKLTIEVLRECLTNIKGQVITELHAVILRERIADLRTTNLDPESLRLVEEIEKYLPK